MSSLVQNAQTRGKLPLKEIIDFCRSQLAIPIRNFHLPPPIPQTGELYERHKTLNKDESWAAQPNDRRCLSEPKARDRVEYDEVSTVATAQKLRLGYSRDVPFVGVAGCRGQQDTSPRVDRRFTDEYACGSQQFKPSAVDGIHSHARAQSTEFLTTNTIQKTSPLLV